MPAALEAEDRSRYVESLADALDGTGDRLIVRDGRARPSDNSDRAAGRMDDGGWPRVNDSELQ